MGESGLLLFYDTAAGAAATGQVDIQGNFTTLRTYDDFSAGWTNITAR